LKSHNIDTLLISQNDYGPDRTAFVPADIRGEYLFLNYPFDTLRIEPKFYSALNLSSLKGQSPDTLRIEFLKLNQTNYADTVIFTIEKRRLFGKTYRTTRCDTAIIQPKYKGTDPAKTCEILINKKIIVLKMSTVDDYGYYIGCGKRASYSRHTRTHEVVYSYHFRP